MKYIENTTTRLLSISRYVTNLGALTSEYLKFLPGVNEIKDEEWGKFCTVNGAENPTLCKWKKKNLLREVPPTLEAVKAAEELKEAVSKKKARSFKSELGLDASPGPVLESL